MEIWDKFIQKKDTEQKLSASYKKKVKLWHYKGIKGQKKLFGGFICLLLLLLLFVAIVFLFVFSNFFIVIKLKLFSRF